MIDVMHYAKEDFHKQATPVGKILLYSGAATFCLSYQVWCAHLRKWHPLTWLLFLFAVLFHGIGSIKEIVKEMSAPEESRPHTYWKAPRKSPMLRADIETALTSVENVNFQDDAGRRYSVGIVAEYHPDQPTEHIVVDLPDGGSKKFNDRGKASWFLQQECRVTRLAA